MDNDGDLDLIITGFEERVRDYRNDLPRQNSIRFQLTGTTSNRGGLGARIEIRYSNGDGEQSQTRYVSPTSGFMSTSENIAHFGVSETKEIASAFVRWPSGISQKLENLETNALYHITEPAESAAVESVERQAKSDAMFKPLDCALEKIRHRELDFDDYLRQPLLPNKYSQLGPGMAWGDIDGDGDHDLFIGAAKGEKSQIVENTGAGKFPFIRQPGFDADLECEDMGSVLFDADGDGDLDLYVVSGGVECEPGDPMLQDRLYLNNGDGFFEKTSKWLPEFHESGGSVAACDFDHDGDVDLFVGGRIIPGAYPESPKSHLLRNTGERFEDVAADVAPDLSIAGMVTAAIWSDVNGDDWTDLLVATEWGPIRFFRNDSGKLIEETGSVGLADRLGWYNSICGGDIDNDGDIDYVVGNTGLNTKYKATVEKPELLFYGDFEGLGRKQIVEAKYENGVCLPRRGLSCSSHAMPMVKEKTPTFYEFAISSLAELYTEEKLDEADKYQANSLESGVLINESANGKISFRFEPLPRIAQASPVFGCQLCDVNADGNLDLYVVQNFYGPQRETGYFDGGVSLLLKGMGPELLNRLVRPTAEWSSPATLRA